MFVVVDLDVLLELAIFVPVFNLDEVLRTVSVSNYSASTQREQQGQGGRRGSATYAQDETLLHQAGQLPQATALVLAGTAAPEHARLFIGGNVDGLEGDAVGAEDGLEARGGGDDVRGAGGEGGEDVEGRVGRVRRHVVLRACVPAGGRCCTARSLQEGDDDDDDGEVEALPRCDGKPKGAAVAFVGLPLGLACWRVLLVRQRFAVPARVA